MNVYEILIALIVAFLAGMYFGANLATTKAQQDDDGAPTPRPQPGEAWSERTRDDGVRVITVGRDSAE